VTTNEDNRPKVTLKDSDAEAGLTARVSLDLVIATCAIFVSVLSLLIAYNQANMMRQQVAATSWPLLQFTSGNTNDAVSKPVLTLGVQNAGVGPAIVKHFTIHHRNREYTNIYKLLSDCCGYRITTFDPTSIVPGTPLTQPIAGTIIRPGETTIFFQMDLAPDNRKSWLLLDKVRNELTFDACYCSVLGECWKSDLVEIDPKSVKSCPPPDKAKAD